MLNNDPVKSDHPPAAIEFFGVTKTFKHTAGNEVTAVNDVSLAIAEGEIVCVLGPSGHGKSTLLNLIGGFISPTAGRVETFGSAIKRPGADRGVIFQRDTLFNWKRVRANVEYGLLVKGTPKEERREIVDRYLKIVGLDEFADEWPRQLSGGMRRRAAIATVFANEPPVMLMDEPFTGLDFARRAELYRVLIDLWERARNTIFFVTHDIDEAVAIASRILVVVNGRVVHDASVTGPRPREGEALLTEEADEIRRAVYSRLEEALRT